MIFENNMRNKYKCWIASEYPSWWRRLFRIGVRKFTLKEISRQEKDPRKHLITTYGRDIENCVTYAEMCNRGNLLDERFRYLQQNKPKTIKVGFYGNNGR